MIAYGIDVYYDDPTAGEKKRPPILKRLHGRLETYFPHISRSDTVRHKCWYPVAYQFPALSMSRLTIVQFTL